MRDDVPEQRVLEQAARLPPGGAVTGWASLRLHGATFFDGLAGDGRTRLPVPLNPGPFHQLSESDACTVSRDRLFAPEITRRHGMPATTPPRALFDEMRYAQHLRAAVVAADMAAAADLVSLRMMRAYVSEHPGWTGVEQVRRALLLASEQSLSPKETVMRLVWVLDAGLPTPACNRPVFTRSGRFVGRPDLLDVEAGVVGEFDGADHRTAERHTRDVEREDSFRRLGLEYFKITGRDLADRSRVVDRMHATRRRARFLSPGDRAWTVDPPGWWKPESTLDEVIAEDLWREELRRQWEAEGASDWPT
ncbi:MAG TPA: hypothetical protein VK964_06050 [Nocardioidaceae bacterium]|nr:hypothetical protein [Nocardioidaceae bacterium]